MACYNQYMEQPERTERTPSEIENEVELIDLPAENKSEKFLSSRLARTLLRWQRTTPRQFWQFGVTLMTVLLAVAALLVIPGSPRPQPTPVAHSQTRPIPTPQRRYSTRGTYRHHPVATYRGHIGYVPTVAWSPDGKRLATGGYDATVQVWDTQTGRRLLVYHGQTKEVHSLAWSPSGRYIVFGDDAGIAYIWDVLTSRQVLTYQGHHTSLLSLAWSPDGSRIVSGGTDTTVQVWDAFTGALITSYDHHADSITSLAWSPDGSRIASVAWSPDSLHLASGNIDGTVDIWRAA